MSDIEGLHFVKVNRPGKPLRWYVYAWRGGPCLMRGVESPTKPKLGKAEIEALGRAMESPLAVREDTLAGLIRQWRGTTPATASAEWSGLAESTRRTWGNQLDAIEKKWGKTPIAFWSDPRMVPEVVAWRDSRGATPRAADNGILVLRELLKFGRLRGRVTINVADGIPTLYHGGGREEIIWTDEHYERFDFHARKEELDHLIDARDLAGDSGLRLADLVTVDRRNIFDHVIVKKALKISKRKRRTVTLPRLPALDATIERLSARPRAEGVTTLLVNSRGRPWSAGGLGGQIGRIIKLAGLEHVDEDTGERRRLHLHDLRGTFCTKLIIASIEAGEKLTDEQVGDIMGWSPDRVAAIRKRYVPQARVVTAISERLRRGA